MSESGLERHRYSVPQPELPPPPVPISEIRRFDVKRDIDEWLMFRLNARWPGYSDQTWYSKLNSFASSNSHFFVTNERCILLMEVKGAHSITGKPVILEVFALSRDARITQDGGRNWSVASRSDGASAMAELYKAAKRWMEDMNAARMIAKTCSDLTPSAVKEVLGGDYIVDLVNR